MAEHEPNWPFGKTDGGPHSRPLVVDLTNVLVAILANTAEGERALQSLQGFGCAAEYLRLYTSDQILAFDDIFRSDRGLKERVVGALIDDADSMTQYLAYARDGCSSLWVLVEDRHDANRMIRHLADREIIYVWFHGKRGVETIRVR